MQLNLICETFKCVYSGESYLFCIVKVIGTQESVNQVEREKMLKIMERATEGKMIFSQHNNLNKLNTLSESQCAIFRS